MRHTTLMVCMKLANCLFFGLGNTLLAGKTRLVSATKNSLPGPINVTHGGNVQRSGSSPGLLSRKGAFSRPSGARISPDRAPRGHSGGTGIQPGLSRATPLTLTRKSAGKLHFQVADHSPDAGIHLHAVFHQAAGV